MTTRGSFNLKGLAEYLEEIAQAGQDVDVAAQRALAKGADVILVEMQSLVPVGDAAKGDPHPGNLLRHIQVKGPLQEGNFNYVEVGVIHDIAYTDEETAIYGNVQEYGNTSNPAQPYIRPALDGKRTAAMDAMKQALQGEGVI